MCRDDGAANRWTGDCSLGWQPSAHRAAPPAHRSPSISHVLHSARPAPSKHTISPVLFRVPRCRAALSLSPPLELYFCLLSTRRCPPPGGKQLSAKTGPNPQLFLPVLKRREKQSVSVLIPPCCAGLKPGLKSTARSHMP